MDKALKFIGIGVLVWLLLKNVGQNISSKLSVGRVRLQNLNVSGQGFSFKLFVEIKNDSSISIPIEGFKGWIKYGNNPLTEINLQNPEIISSNSVVDIPFNINLSFNQLSATIISMVQSGQWLNNLYLEGTIFSEGIGIPVYKSIIAV